MARSSARRRGGCVSSEHAQLLDCRSRAGQGETSRAAVRVRGPRRPSRRRRAACVARPAAATAMAAAFHARIITARQQQECSRSCLSPMFYLRCMVPPVQELSAWGSPSELPHVRSRASTPKVKACCRYRRYRRYQLVPSRPWYQLVACRKKKHNDRKTSADEAAVVLVPPSQESSGRARILARDVACHALPCARHGLVLAHEFLRPLQKAPVRTPEAQSSKPGL